MVRNCLWNGTTVCQGPGWSVSRRSAERVLRSSQVVAEGVIRTMRTEPQHTCPSCGDEFSGAMEFCPVCMLRKALAGGVESGESAASEVTVDPISEQTEQQFEHYRLVMAEDGKPVELGRGA